jgi:hypothetical protein
MPLITRQYGPNAKGSKLTIEEMDDNLLYLQASYQNLGNSGTTTEINWSDAAIQELNLDDNPTLTFTNGVVGQKVSLLLRQELVGIRTVTWPNEVEWVGGIAPTLQDVVLPDIAYNQIDFVFNGTSYIGSY